MTEIDVSGCEFIDEYKHCDICKELIKTKEGRTHCFTQEDISCEFYPYCHYKQLKRLEAENAKLKEALEEIRKLNSSCADCDCYNACGACSNAEEKPYRSFKIANEVLKDE